MQQGGRGDHQHTGRVIVAGWVQAQAEVAVRYPAGFQDLTVGVRAELRHWPAPAAGGWVGHQATRPDQDVDLKRSMPLLEPLSGCRHRSVGYRCRQG
jgi:hypothetical protein